MPKQARLKFRLIVKFRSATWLFILSVCFLYIVLLERIFRFYRHFGTTLNKGAGPRFKNLASPVTQ